MKLKYVHELEMLKIVYKFIKIICLNVLIIIFYLLRKFIITQPDLSQNITV